MTSKLTKEFEARLNKQSGSKPPSVEKKPTPVKPSPKPPPNRKPTLLKSSLAKELNSSLAEKVHKPHSSTSKLKVSTKPNQLHSKVNGGPSAKDSPGAAALANLLQTSALKKSASPETKIKTFFEPVTDSGTPTKSTNPGPSNTNKSPKPLPLTKALSVSTSSKLRSLSDGTERPFSSVEMNKIFDKEFIDESPRKRSSPVVTPSGSPFLASNRKNRAMTSMSGSHQVSPKLSGQAMSVCDINGNEGSSAVGLQVSMDKFKRATSLPPDTIFSLSLEEDGEKVKSGLEKSSLLADRDQETSESDLTKAVNTGVKRKTPPPPPSKPVVRGPRPQVQPKPPTRAALKVEAGFSKRQSSVSGSRETSPDPVNPSQETTSRRSLESDSLEDTLKASSSTRYSDINEMEDTLKAENEKKDDWVLVDKNKIPPPVSEKSPPSPLKVKKQSSPTLLTGPLPESPQTDSIKPIPPSPLVTTASVQSCEASPKSTTASENVSKDIDSSSTPSSPVIIITRTTSNSGPPVKSRSASDSIGSSRVNTDSGFGSEVPDDVSLARGQSVESLLNSPPVRTAKDTEVWDEARLEKARSKRKNIANELLTTEKTYVERIKCIAVDFYELVDQFNMKTKQSIPASAVQQIFLNIQPIYLLNKNILQELQARMDNWSTHEGLGDVIARLAPFLKLYATYTAGFEDAIKALTEWTKKDRKFDAVLRDFQRETLIRGLGVSQYMLEPVQRIPRYKLLVSDYLKYLPPDSPDRPDTTKALNIISEAADHANDRIKELENSNEILTIQRSITDYEGTLLAPSRVFLKKGELQKLSRKTSTPRMFFLFSDILLHTQPSGSDIHKFRNEMPIFGMQVEEPKVSMMPHCFNVHSTTRSLILMASSEEEKQEWFMTLKKAISQDTKKRSSLKIAQFVNSSSDNDMFSMKAPIMVPDKSVTMCQACSSEFTFTFRRHHCRACGKVVCGNCSQWKAFLTYMDKVERVCEVCHVHSKGGSVETDGGEPIPKTLKKQESISCGVLNIKGLEDDAVIAGYVMEQDGRKWNRIWYQVKRDFVLYKFKAHEDIKAIHSMPLPGYIITPDRASFVINLIHPSSKKDLCDTVKVEDPVAFDSWLEVLGKVVNMEMPEQTSLSPTSKHSSLANSLELHSRPASSLLCDDRLDNSGSSFENDHSSTTPCSPLKTNEADNHCKTISL